MEGLGGIFALRRRGWRETRPEEDKKETSANLDLDRLCECQLCGDEIMLTRNLELAVRSVDLCARCERQECTWLSIRPWVCLNALVSQQRAFPIWNPPCRPCESWEDEGAAEQAILLASGDVAVNSARATSEGDWSAVAAFVVSLPEYLLACVLEYAFDGSGEMLAGARSLAGRDTSRVESSEHSGRVRRCVDNLLSTGSCLHGRLVMGPRRTAAYACWYCSRTFPLKLGADELETHCNIEHSSDINAWISKARKNKARRQRLWYRANMGTALSMVRFEHQAGKLLVSSRR